MASKVRFRFALRRQARLAYLQGNITKEDWQHVQGVLEHSVRTAADGSQIDLIDEVADDMTCHLQSEGKMTAEENVESIDWGKLLEWIKQLMPMIMQFIQALLLIFPK